VPGTSTGVTAADEGDSGPSPTVLVAWTVHVYVVPLLRPVTVSGDAGPDAACGGPGGVVLHVAVYPVIASPLLFGGVNVT
jgi:hypothetical protein